MNASHLLFLEFARASQLQWQPSKYTMLYAIVILIIYNNRKNKI